MRQLHPDWGMEQIIDYNLRPKAGTTQRGTSFSIFENTQHYRVDLTRKAIQSLLDRHPERRMSIIEPGCSAGDISGYFSQQGHEVWGNDVVPAAIATAQKRWPRATFNVGPSEAFAPRECDVLVMCEFLEHIADPVGFVKEWMPLAKYAVISHPLVGDGHDPEKGHYWAYDIHDFRDWFAMTGFEVMHEQYFRMGYHMILGTGVKK